MDNNYGERLRRLRGNRRIVDVAKTIGISPSALSMYENTERMPKDDIKIRLANYYGRTVGYIFFDKSHTHGENAGSISDGTEEGGESA